MKDRIERTDLKFRTGRMARTAFASAAIMSGFFGGLVALTVPGRMEAIILGCFFSIVSLFFSCGGVVCHYLGARLATPRTVRLERGELVFRTPHETRVIPVRRIRWKVGSATEDGRLGWYLEDRRCLIFTVRGLSGRAMLGYTKGTPEEWIMALEHARSLDPDESGRPLGPQSLAAPISLGASGASGLLYSIVRIQRVGFGQLTDVELCLVIGSTLGTAAALLVLCRTFLARRSRHD